MSLTELKASCLISPSSSLFFFVQLSTLRCVRQSESLYYRGLSAEYSRLVFTTLRKVQPLSASSAHTCFVVISSIKEHQTHLLLISFPRNHRQKKRKKKNPSFSLFFVHFWFLRNTNTFFNFIFFLTTQP